MDATVDADVLARVLKYHGAFKDILDLDVFAKVLNYHSAIKKIPFLYKPAGVCVDKLFQLKKEEEDYEVDEEDDISDEENDDEDEEYINNNDNEDANDDDIINAINIHIMNAINNGIMDDSDDDNDDDANNDNEEDVDVENNNEDEYFDYEDNYGSDDDDFYVDDDSVNISYDTNDLIDDNENNDTNYYSKKITEQQRAIVELIQEAVKMEKRANVSSLHHVVCLKVNVFDCCKYNKGVYDCSLKIQTAATEAVKNEIEMLDKAETTNIISISNSNVMEVNYTSATYANSGDLAKYLWEAAPIKEGAYGDIRQQETKVDPKVRNARDYLYSLGHFSCSSSLLLKLACFWSNHMYPYQSHHVTVRPYKINCYEPLGCFATHVDTPDVDMVGTILLGLGQTDTDGTKNCSTNACHLCFTDNNGKRYWNPKFGNVCMFYSDVPHTVVANGRYRATAAFKVYSKNRVENVHQDILKMARETLPRRPIGFLFSREYTHDSTAMKGIDGIFNEIVHQSGLYEDIKLVSVLVKTHKTYRTEDDEAEMYSKVYIITNDRIEKSCSGKKRNKHNQDAMDAICDIDFYRVAGGYKWSRVFDEGAEWAGNECRAGELNSVYLHKALIAYPPKEV